MEASAPRLSAMARISGVLVAAMAAAFLVVPEIVAASAMIAVIPERLARDHTDRLQVLEPPLAVPGFDIAMVWHDRTTTHPTQRWLREQMVRVARRRSAIL